MPESRSKKYRHLERFTAFEIRNYRNYFIGTAISNSGNWAHRIAQDWLILELTNSPQWLGIVLAAQFAPGFLLSLYAGSLAEKIDQRRALLYCNYFGSLIALALGALVIGGSITPLLVSIAAFLLGCANAIDGPIRQSYYVLLVGEKILPSAISLNSANINIGRLLGPALAGFVIDKFGIGEAIILNSISYLICAFTVAGIKKDEYLFERDKITEKIILSDGLRYFGKNKKLLYTVIAVSFLAMWGQDMQFASALMAKNVFASSALGFGFLGTSIAAGAILGAISMARHFELPTIELLIKRSLFMSGIWFLTALAPNYLLFALALFGCGFFSMGVNISGNGGIRTYASAEFYGRAWGIYIFLWQTLIALGGIILGTLGASFSPRIVIFLGATMALLMTSLLAIKFPTPESRV